MNIDRFIRDHEVLEACLTKHVEADTSLRSLEKKPDKKYGILYIFDLNPCCVPLHYTSWINAQTPGVFFRCFFLEAKDAESKDRVMSCIEPINYNLPAGCFAMSPSSEVLFKNAVYYGELPLLEEIVHCLVEPSFEFVGMFWQEILNAILGISIGIHNH